MKTIRRLFPLNSAMPATVRVFGLGVREQMRAGMVERREGGKHYLLLYFHGASSIAGRAQPAGTAMVWEPGHPQKYGHATASWNHSWIALNGEFVRKQLRATKLPLNHPLEGVAISAIFDGHLMAMFRELSDHAQPDTVILKNTIQNLLRELDRALNRPAPRMPVPHRYRVLRRYIDEHFDQRLDLDGLAERTHASRWHFCREFNRYFGVSPIHYMLQLRMRHAADLLRDPDLNISEIARQCGYADIFHFSKLFRKHHGMSPRQLRNSF